MHLLPQIALAVTLLLPNLPVKNQRQLAINNYQQGLHERQNGNYPQAVEFFRQAAQQNPVWGIPQLELAYTLRLLGAPLQERQSSLEGLKDTVSQNPRYHYELGLLHRDNGDATAAIAALNDALAIRPEYTEARYELAYQQQQTGQYQSAKENFLVLLNYQPENNAFLLGVANSAQALEDAETEEKALLELVRLSQHNTMMLLRLRDFYKRQQRLTEANKIDKIIQDSKEQRPMMRELPKARI